MGVNLNFIKLAGNINDKRPSLLSEEIKRYLKIKFKDKTNIAVFGVTLKKTLTI